MDHIQRFHPDRFAHSTLLPPDIAFSEEQECLVLQLLCFVSDIGCSVSGIVSVSCGLTSNIFLDLESWT